MAEGNIALNPSSCSFCGRPKSRTAELVGGPGVAICDSCVQTAATLLMEAETSSSSASKVSPWDTMNDAELLAHLPEIASVAGQVETRLLAWVTLARERGISWARIGTALGMTRQSAWERFHQRPASP